MSKRKNRSKGKASGKNNAKAKAEKDKADEQPAVIPDSPPMSGKTGRWPLVAVFGAYVAWLVWLAYLAANSGRYTPGG